MKLTSIQKWGNSFAIRIPRAVVEEMGLEEGQEFRVEKAREGRGMSLTPASSAELPLNKLLARITPDNQHELLDWGTPVGKEVW